MLIYLSNMGASSTTHPMNKNTHQKLYWYDTEYVSPKARALYKLLPSRKYFTSADVHTQEITKHKQNTLLYIKMLCSAGAVMEMGTKQPHVQGRPTNLYKKVKGTFILSPGESPFCPHDQYLFRKS